MAIDKKEQISESWKFEITSKNRNFERGLGAFRLSPWGLATRHWHSISPKSATDFHQVHAIDLELLFPPNTQWISAGLRNRSCVVNVTMSLNSRDAELNGLKIGNKCRCKPDKISKLKLSLFNLYHKTTTILHQSKTAIKNGRKLSLLNLRFPDNFLNTKNRNYNRPKQRIEFLHTTSRQAPNENLLCIVWKKKI